MTAIKAGGLYFLIVFAAGWVFGPIRVFWVAPRTGPLVAVLIEAPFMLAVMVVAARWVIARLQLRTQFRARALMGATALALVLTVELALAAPLRGQSLPVYLASLANPAGAISLAMFLIFAAIPSFVRRDRP